MAFPMWLAARLHRCAVGRHSSLDFVTYFVPNSIWHSVRQYIVMPHISPMCPLDEERHVGLTNFLLYFFMGCASFLSVYFFSLFHFSLFCLWVLGVFFDSFFYLFTSPPFLPLFLVLLFLLKWLNILQFIIIWIQKYFQSLSTFFSNLKYFKIFINIF